MPMIEILAAFAIVAAVEGITNYKLRVTKKRGVAGVL
jgi:hypothetical protein